MVKKVVMNFDSSKASRPDIIAIVVLKTCKQEFLFMLVELFGMCLKESCFPNCCKVSSLSPIFKNFGERLLLKTAALLVFFLWLVKSLKNL